MRVVYFKSEDDGDGTYEGQIWPRLPSPGRRPTGDEGRDLGFITLAAAAGIAREHDAELDVDGPAREEWDEITEPPRRSFLSRLLGQ